MDEISQLKKLLKGNKMAFSSSEGKLFFKDWLIQMFLKNQVRTVLDIGAGAGIYGKLIREAWDEANVIKERFDFISLEGDITIGAIEIFEPYIERFKLREIYDSVICANVFTKAYDFVHHDLVIFGDVLEHMTKDEATIVWNAFKTRSKFLYLSMPCKIPGKSWSEGYEQQSDEWQENKNEQHLHDWTYDEILSSLGPFLWQVPLPTVVTMIAEGNL